jgi:hypothetical protein
LDKNLLTWQPKIEGKKRGRTPGVPPLSHSSGEYWKWVPPVPLIAPSNTQAGLDPTKPML